MVPTAGLNDQVNPRLRPPATAAVNCWVSETVRETVEGDSETLPGVINRNCPAAVP
jgi:hypothetical protein